MSLNKNAINSLTEDRNRSMGINLANYQATTTPVGLTHEVMQVPSSSLPVLGSYFICDLKTKGLILHNFALNVNMTALTGLTGGTSPRLSPAMFWVSRAEIVINNVIIDTVYPVQQFIKNNIIYSNDDRQIFNAGMGSYNSITQRALMASTAGQNYIIPFHTIFDETNYSLLSDSHSVQIRFYLANMADIIVSGGASGTGAVSINFANLICKTTKLSPEVMQNKLALMNNSPETHLYHSLRYGIFNVNSGVSSSQIVLSSITGKVAFLFFVMRNVGALTGDGAFTYNKITNFSLLDATSSNITSGQPVSDAIALNYLSKYWSYSTYQSETATGVNQIGTIQNNGANVYCWSFSQDIKCLLDGSLRTSRTFYGNEQLILNYNLLTSNAVVEVFAMTESMVEQGTFVVKQLSA